MAAPTVPLIKVAKVIMGQSPPGDTYNEDGDGLPLLNGPTEFGTTSPTCTQFTTDSRRECEAGDLIFCVRGSTTGRMNWADRKYSLGRGVCGIRGETAAETRFVRYCIQDQLHALLQLAGGGTFPNLTKDDIEEFEIPWPDNRARIAGILSAYDELMENSQRRIRLLEAMARALYREWFVHFRIPAEVLTKAGASRIKLVASPLGPIPHGWKVKKLGDVVTYNRRATKPGSHLEDRRYVPIDCLPSKSLALLEAEPIEEAQSSLQLFEKGDILFGAMRAYFHKVAVAPFNGVTRTTCFVFKPTQPEWKAFATMTVFEEATVAYANSHSQGATIPYAVWDGSLSEMPLVLPPDDLLRQFEKVVAPMLAHISQSFFTLNNLRRTRDLLLPRLLSGQVVLNFPAASAFSKS